MDGILRSLSSAAVLACFLLCPPSATAAVIGNIDKLAPLASGSLAVHGWACATGNPQPISVDLYLGGPWPTGVAKGRTPANQPSEPAVAVACKSTGATYRFAIPLSAELRAQSVGKKIYVHGIDPNGGANPLLGNSGVLTVPADTYAPTIGSFTLPAVSRTPTLSPIALRATDDLGVAGYLLTESATRPLPGATGWSVTPPTSYTLKTPGFGIRTVYAWAKDAAGNISGKSATVEITPIRGNVDGVYLGADGKAAVHGWACASGSPSSIFVELYLGGSWPQGAARGRSLANRASEPAVAQACSSTGSAYRFWIPLTAEVRSEFASQKIFIHGINPNGGANPLITGSGVFAVPIDTRPPTLTSFTLPATADSRTVIPLSLAATDDVQVTGFQLTELPTRPLIDSPGWCSSAVCPYSFSPAPATEGRRTLYAWARDAAGNISEPRMASFEFVPLPASSAVIHVDPVAGDDQRGGLSGLPVRTISRALQLLGAPGGQVRLQSGNYFEKIRIENRENSVGPLSISPAPGATATLYCSRPLSDAITRRWSRVPNIPNTWWITSEALFPDATGIGGAPFALFHGSPGSSSTFIPLARFPEEGLLAFGDGSLPGSPTNLVFNPEAIARIGSADLRNATIHWRKNDYEISDNTIAAYNSGTGTATLGEALTYAAKKDWGFYLENKPWMLTSPWRWAYDDLAKTVYLRTPEGVDPNTLHLRGASNTVQGRCIEITRAANITLAGLNILEAGPSAILVKDSRDISLHDLRIRNAGARAIVILAATPGVSTANIRIADSAIESTQQEAISLLHADPSLRVGSLEVTGNTFSDIGMLGSLRHITAAVNAGLADRLRFIGNRITRTAYNGVYFPPGSHILNNVVESACQLLDDCGGIYTWNGVRDSQRLPIARAPSLVERNLVFGANGARALPGKPAAQGLFPCAGVYLDDLANNVTVNANVLYDNERGINLNTPANQTFFQNLVFSNRSMQFALNSGNLTDVRNISIKRNRLFTTTANAPVAIPYSPAELLGNTARTYWDRNQYLAALRPQVQNGQAYPGFSLLNAGDARNAGILKVLVNPDGAPRSFACPTGQTPCSGWKTPEGLPVSFPVLLDPRGTFVLIWSP